MTSMPHYKKCENKIISVQITRQRERGSEEQGEGQGKDNQRKKLNILMFILSVCSAVCRLMQSHMKLTQGAVVAQW